MQAIPLQRPLGWPSVLWSDFPAAEDAIASKQLDILSGGIAVPCVQSHPNGCECSAAGLGGRTHSPDPPLCRESGPWPPNTPPVFPPFAFTRPPDSVIFGKWPRFRASRPTPTFVRHTTTKPHEEDGSRTKALAFFTAFRILRRRLPLSAGRGPQSVTRESLDAEISAAKAWLVAHPATTGSGSGLVRYLSMENFRG